MIDEFSKEKLQLIKFTIALIILILLDHVPAENPEIGLIKKAQVEFNLNLSKSILIGDKISDIQAGKNAGIGSNILIEKNKIPRNLKV